METCEVTFDETSPSPSPVFELACPNQMSETIFVQEKHDDDDCGDLVLTPLVTPVEPTSTILDNGPNMSTSTSWGSLELKGAEPRGVEPAVEGEATSSSNAPCHVQCDHPPQYMIGELHE